MKEKEIMKASAYIFLITLLLTTFESDAPTPWSNQSAVIYDTNTTAALQQTPENITDQLARLPNDVVINSAQLILYDNKNIRSGSGMLVEQVPGYDIFLTAKHVVAGDNFSPVFLKAQYPYIASLQKFGESADYGNFWTFADDNKDIAIIVAKSKNTTKNSKVPVDINWNPKSGDKLLSLTFPGTNIVSQFVLYEPEVMGPEDIDSLIPVRPSNSYGSSGSVLTDNLGNIDGIIIEMSYSKNIDYPFNYVVKVGDTLQKLLNQASQELGVTF